MATFHEELERERLEAFPAVATDQLRRYRSYVQGKQRNTLSIEQMRMLANVRDVHFSDNICRQILSVTTSRTVFSGWDVDNEMVADYLAELDFTNQLPALQSQTTFATLRDGNLALALRFEPDDAHPRGGSIRFHRERWWDGKSGVYLHYDDVSDTEPVYAVKEWTERVGDVKRLRRTVYFDDHFIRFEKDAQGWRSYWSEEYPSGVVPWLKMDGTPLGIPLIHFRYGSDDDQPYGRSDLANVLGFQDQLNQLHYDITMAGSMAGYQMTTSTGTQVERNDEGRMIPPRVGPGQHLHADESDARFGVIPAGDLSQLISAYEMKLKAVCNRTSIPYFMFTGQWPSGEALLRAEVDLVEKVRMLVENIGPSWTKAAHRSTEIQNVFGSGEWLDEDDRIQAVFADPARRDRFALSQIAQREMVYTSVEEALRTTGRTQDQIDRILEERSAATSANAANFGAAFGRGVPELGDLDGLEQ